jgi:SAM-dependent methyltransferase
MMTRAAGHYAVPGVTSVLPLGDADIPKRARKILDLGCGNAEATVRALGVPSSEEAPRRFVCGVDIDMNSLCALKMRAPYLHCVRALAEELPFKAECFDYVMSGVALPYMDIPRALREIRRVLKPEGEFWASLHRPLVVWGHLLKSIRTFKRKDVLYRAYVLANALSFHFTGRAFRFPLNRKRIESGQTRGGIRQALELTGFTDIVMNQGGERFVVRAKPSEF